MERELRVGDVVEVVGPCNTWRLGDAWVGTVAAVREISLNGPVFEFIYRPEALKHWEHPKFSLYMPTKGIRFIGNTYDKA